MKNLAGILTLAALITTHSAWANENTATMSASEAAPTPLYKNWSFEVNANLLGNYNENTYKVNSDTVRGLSADFGIDIAIRRNLIEFLSTGLRIPIYASIAGMDSEARSKDLPGDAVSAYPFPVMWTARVQPTSLFGQSFFRPWAEAEAGLSLIVLSPYYQSSGQERTPDTLLVRPAFRASAGFDVQPIPASDRIFVTARASYLFLKDFSNYQFALGTGFRL